MRLYPSQTALMMALILGVGTFGLAETPEYDLLYQMHVPPFSDLIVDRVQDDIDNDISQRKDGESEADHAIRKQVGKNIRDALTAAIPQLEHVRLGLKLDRSGKRIYLDFTATALDGTKLAKRLDEVKRLKTSFAGTQLPSATLAGHWVGQNSEEEAAAAVSVVRMIRANELKKIDDAEVADHEKEIRRHFANIIFDVIQATVSSGRSDGGFSLMLKADGVTLVGGGYVADGKKLEGVFKPVAAYVRDNHADAAHVELDFETIDKVAVHKIAFPAPTGNERQNFLRMFGESLDVLFAFDNDAVFVAAGKDAMNAMRNAIKESANPVVPDSPFEISLSLKPVADFIGATGQGPEAGFTSLISGVLGKAEGRDHVRLQATSIDRGIILRGEVERGLLELVSTVLPETRKLLLGED